MDERSIDWISFHTSVALILAICIPLVAFPGQGGAMLESIFQFITDELGIVYLLASLSCIGLLVWLAFGRQRGCVSVMGATTSCVVVNWGPSGGSSTSG